MYSKNISNKFQVIQWISNVTKWQKQLFLHFHVNKQKDIDKLLASTLGLILKYCWSFWFDW